MTKEEQYEAVREDIGIFIYRDSHPQRYITWAGLKRRFPDTVKAIYGKVDKILSDPRIAIVDEDQCLPKNPYVKLDATKGHYHRAQKDMLKSNFVRVIPKEVMKKWQDVDENTFNDFVKNYPTGLVYDYCAIREPPMSSFNDFSKGEIWPESMAARCFPLDNPPKYQIKR